MNDIRAKIRNQDKKRINHKQHKTHRRQQRQQKGRDWRSR